MRKLLVRLLAFICILAAASVLFSACEYLYVKNKFKDIRPIAPVEYTGTYAGAGYTSSRIIHKANTAARAKAKEGAYDGYELDLFVREDGKMVVAHDEKHIDKGVSVEEIFATVKRPKTHVFWLDLKRDLTREHIDNILDIARKTGVAEENLFFEVMGGAGESTIKILKEKNLRFLYQITEGFDRDGGDPAKRRELNARLKAEIEKYEPFAIGASAGKYPYLKTYFPNMNKAIHYSTSKAPTLKKYFVARKLLSDPSVKLVVTDEYTCLPF
ncbi:hypothetical protein Dip518_000513 [Parelusimicrobium proximum]|uniref:hypothetical protein n=1 Tax=Parelusimicrobium proximum TaxID=3228953 RepID=UPI003D16D745